jgi:hypothetical protein
VKHHHPFLAPVGTACPQAWDLYAAMLVVWHLRPATQCRFPLHKGRIRDQIRFLAWCATNGRREYQILREIPAWDEHLRSALDLPRLIGDRWEGSHSLMNFLHGIALHRWSLSGMISSSAARHRSARHFWRGARHRNHAPSISSWQKEALQQSFGSLAGLARAISMKKHASATGVDLVEKYELKDLHANDHTLPRSNERDRITLPPRITRSPFPLPQPWVRLFEPLIQLTRRNPPHEESMRVMQHINVAPREPAITKGELGVNLIGYARGELGIGEDIRQVAMALQAQNIPVCILDFAPGKNISQADDGAECLMSDKPLYGINLFCLTGIETTRYVCEKGLSALEGRYNIGLWPWELPDWPENCRHAYACVDEVWGISQYTAHAHRHAAPRPVIPMGLPVVLGPLDTQIRKDFGLPGEAYLFYFAFDINSKSARKNPEGLIKAFQAAFPKKDKDQVGLVLKISHPETGCKLWSKIRKIARQDKRIHVIEKTMRKPELLALFKACDCLVSLHRAEGFGRCIAEALLLSKQVIATEFSGNLDFCHEPRVALVRHSMRKVEAKDYMWGEGQMWAEPDLDHAAELMRSIWQEPRELESGSYIFDPQSIGQRYKERLEEIWQQYASKPLAEALEHRTSNIEY